MSQTQKILRSNSLQLCVDSSCGSRNVASLRTARTQFTVIAVACVFVCVSMCTQATIAAQQDNGRIEYYGSWAPPQTGTAGQASEALPAINRDNFRSYFPPRTSQQTTTSRLRPRDEQAERNNIPIDNGAISQPAKHFPSNARPLQPMISNNSNSTGMMQGRIVEPSDFQPVQPKQQTQPAQEFRTASLPPFSNNLNTQLPAQLKQPSNVVRQANFESLAKPLENLQNKFASTASEFSAPPRDSNTALGQPGAITNVANEATSATSNLQSWLKNASSGWFGDSQSSGGWREKVSGIFRGMNDKTRKMVGSLALVLGGYFAFVTVMRKINPQGNRGIPTEVVEVIGNTPFGPRKNLQLVRLGSKLLLLMNTPEGTHPVGEITEVAEVEYLVSLCSGKRSKASQSVLSAIDTLRKATGGAATGYVPTENSFTKSNLASSTIANSGASATAISEVLRALENRKPATVFEA